MPRSAEQFEAMRAESRSRLVTTALDLFARQGYESTSVRQIAEAAGVAQGLLYNYFAGKEGLLQAIFEQCMADVERSFAAAAQPHPHGPLEGLIRASFQIVREQLPFWRLSYSLRGQPAVLAGLGSTIADWSALIREQLAAHYQAQGSTQPELDGALLFATIDGVAQHYALDPEGYPLDLVVERLIERYC